MNNHEKAYELLVEQLHETGHDVEKLKARIRTLNIETPSWAYGNSGTRFGVFAYPGAARNVYEKIDDASYVHSLTGAAPSIALHIPWDKVQDWEELAAYAEDRNIRIGAINPNLFQDDNYKLGSVCHPDHAVRQKAIDHLVECCDIMELTGSNLLSLWLADGTNYAGQDSMVERKHRLQDSLQHVYENMPNEARLLIEYKFFEPSFYHTDLADWGTAYAMTLKLGERAQVLVDTGHHAQGTNIAHIVSFLLDEQKLGGFHFNARRYADDDLIVGTNNPMELFEIFVELVAGEQKSQDVAFMIDQSHNIEPKIEAMILSIINCQIAYAKALLVDFAKLRRFQKEGDVLGAHQVLMEAYETDVRPLLAQVRLELGLATNPIATHRTHDYVEKRAAERE